MVLSIFFFYFFLMCLLKNFKACLWLAFVDDIMFLMDSTDLESLLVSIKSQTLIKEVMFMNQLYLDAHELSKPEGAF